MTVEEFLACLRLTKIWAGDPSFEELRRRSGVPSSTLADALSAKRRTLPRLDVVRRFVLACGLGPAALPRWEAAWRGLRAMDCSARAWLEEAGTTTGPPRQLPRDITRFVGRRDALGRLDQVQREHLSGRRRSPLVMVVGPPGVGKTALAVRWAQQVADAYPDGQLYVDLSPARGHCTTRTVEILSLVLHSLGMPAARVPANPSAMVGLYRSLSQRRRFLLLVDGAEAADVVRPLLPAGPQCFTLVTSRRRLPSLVAQDDALRIDLPPLDPEEAVDLLVSMLATARGHRDRCALRELARRCEYVPLALRIAAEHLADTPQGVTPQLVLRRAEGNDG